jgi:hypothetical protein
MHSMCVSMHVCQAWHGGLPGCRNSFEVHLVQLQVTFNDSSQQAAGWTVGVAA